MGMGGEVEVGLVLVGVCPGRIASSAFLLLIRAGGVERGGRGGGSEGVRWMVEVGVARRGRK